MKDDKKKIIKEIRDKLHNQEMSVLIGSGFSKNANLKFPLWYELLKDLIIELYNEDYMNWRINNHYNQNEDENLQKDLNFSKNYAQKYGYLELVEKYIKYKGLRESITFYIEDRIKPLNDDIDNLDLETHKKLLHCPWNNIYTTNYDTLIERAAESFDEYNSRVIINSSDLSIGPSKRIVKLHGSLRTKTEIENKVFGFDNDRKSHYIISKSDYEAYTEKHSAFTNIMRSALLQESFCLIGFSGSDPNFLGWIDWVREILKNAKEKKVYFVDVNDKKCDREKELFLNNHMIKYVYLRDLFGKSNQKKLINEFLNEVKPRNALKKKQKFTKSKKSYYNLWEQLGKSEFLSEKFITTIKEIEENEKYFKLANFSIYYKAELIINQNRHKFIDSLKKNKINKLEILNFISIIQRNSYYNLSAIFSSEQLQILVEEFSLISIKELKNSEIKDWVSFGICLLKDYRYILEEDKFDELAIKIQSIETLQLEFLEEIYYQKSLFSAITMNYKKLINRLDNWNITNNSSGWSCIRKAFLLNSLKINKYNNEIIRLINLSIKQTDIEQDKLWFYEIISSYNFSTNLTKDDRIDAKINSLKSKGFYSLEDVIKSLTENKKNVEIKPSDETRYTITTSWSNNSHNVVDWDSVRFVEFIFNTGYPLIPDIQYPVSVFNKTKWFDIFMKIYEGMPQEMLFLSFQYSGNDAYENFIRSAIQKIVFNQNISNDLKNNLFQNYSNSFFYYYNDIENYKPTFLFAISELISCLQFKKWSLFINKFWDLQTESNKIVYQKFYSNVWGLEKVIQKIIPYIEDNKLLNKMICSFFEFSKTPKEDDGELVALRYIENILNNNSFFTPYKLSIKRIGKYIELLLKKENLSNYDLLKIYHYNRSFSKAYNETIIGVVTSIVFSKNHLLYWNLILELSNNNRYVNKRLREYLLSNNTLIFYTGINANDGRSGGGIYFSIFKTFKTLNKRFFLDWSKEQILDLYNNLQISLMQLAKYKKGKDKLLFFDDKSILNDMLEFLNINSKVLKDKKDYRKTLDQVKTLYIAELGFNNTIAGFLSNDRNQIQNSIISLYKQYKTNPNEINEVAWLTFLMRILRKDRFKLELSIEYLSFLLSNILINQEWPLKYKSFYIKILNEYYENIPIENTNRIFIEYYFIKIANSLRTNWNVRDSIITKWLQIRKTSNFLKIKNMKLKKSR